MRPAQSVAVSEQRGFKSKFDTLRRGFWSRVVRHTHKLYGVIALILAGVTTTSLVALLGTVIYPRDRSHIWHVDNSLNWRLSNPFWRMSAVFAYTSRNDGMWNANPSRVRRESRAQGYLEGIGPTYTPNLRVSRRSWFIHEAGWPMKASWGWECTESSPESEQSTHGWIVTVPIRRKSGFDTAPFPIRPLWLGFTMNSILYAAFWGGLYSIPVTIRRTLRVRRGLCPHCAYDMRCLTNTPCPECGRASRVTSPAGASPPSRPASARPRG